MQQGYYEKAIAEAADGRQRTGNKDALWNWKFRLLEAEALMRNAQPRQSIDLLSENPPANFPTEITARKRLIEGQALCRADRIADGQALLQEAEGLIPAGSLPLQAELAFSRGYCTFSTPIIARQYFEKAAELARTAAPFTAASALGNVGYILSQQGRYDEAIEWFQKVLPLAQVVKSELIEEKTLGNLGDNYAELGDFKEAIDNLEKAQGIADEIGRLEDEEAWLVSLGKSYASSRDYPAAKAESSYLHALSLATKLRDAKGTNLCLHDLALLALDENDLPRAKSYWQQEAANISPGNPSEVDAWIDEEQIAMAERNLGKAEEILQRIDRDPRTTPSHRAFAQSQMGKAYWMEHKNAEAGRMLRESIRTVEKALSHLKEQYRASFLDEHTHRFDAYISFLISQGQPIPALAQAEHLRELDHGHAHRVEKAFNLAAIQKRLRGRNQVILDYHVTDEQSFLWLITAQDVQLFHLPSHRELSELVDRHNKAIQEQRSMEDSTAGRQLYSALIQPAEKFIPRGAHVSIVPSKILWLLNFETLIVPHGNAHYWIEDVVVQNASSLLRASRSSLVQDKNNKELLLMGAPEEVNPAFPTLKYAADEIRRVKEHFPAAQELVISGSGATPAAYQASRPRQYRLIHFVTHGIPNEKIPMQSAIVLSGTDSSYKLYAHDIVLTPLHADLVTISACYGAGKRWYVSEGMVGLGWAFMQAGARQVIAALWEVDDASTPQLMDDFYRELSRHRATADALRQAKLAMVKSNGPHKLPYYWGSLQLYIGS